MASLRRGGEERRSAFVKLQTAGAPPIAVDADGCAPSALAIPPQPADRREVARPSVRGKFLYAGTRSCCVRGVTYGTFRPDEDGRRVPAPAVVERDFAADGGERHQRRAHLHGAARRGCSTRAADHGSARDGRAAVGAARRLPRRPRRCARSIERRVRAGRPRVRRAPGRALLRDRQRDPRPDRPLARAAADRAFLRRLYDAAKEEDPGRAGHVRQLPVDRVPRPAVPRLRRASTSTSRRRSGWRPTSPACRTSPATARCVMAEIGLDSRRNGEERQAEVLDWQVRTRVRGRLRRRVRVRLDRRMAPRRARDRRLGLRAHRRATARPKPALAAVSRAPSPRLPFAAARLAAGLGRGLQPTTARAPSANASRPGRRSTTPTTR